MDTNDLLTVRQAAAELGTSVPNLHHYIADGRLPAKKYGRDYLIRREDLDALERPRPGWPAGRTRKQQ